MKISKSKIKNIVKESLKEYADWGGPNLDLSDDPDVVNKPSGKEAVIQNAAKKGIIYWPPLFKYSTFLGKTDMSVNGYFTFREHPDKSKEVHAGNATPLFRSGPSGCANWVGKFVGPLAADAWTAHSNNFGSRKFSIFDGLSAKTCRQLAMYFTQCNKDYPDSLKEEGYKHYIRDHIRQALRYLSKIKPVSADMIELGDVVGMIYNRSSHVVKPFMEGATGRTSIQNAGGRAISGGPYFINAKTKNRWSVKDLGKDIKFIPGKTILNGNGFGFNSHVGFCGAKVSGIPIIYHVYQKHGENYLVSATPLTVMGSGKKFSVAWVKKP